MSNEQQHDWRACRLHGGNVQVRANALDCAEEVRFDSRGEGDREIIRHRSLCRGHDHDQRWY